MVVSWATSQLSLGRNSQARRRLANRPRSCLSLPKTWLQRLKGPWSTVPWPFPTLSTHAVLGAVQPRPGRPSCLTAVGPKPLGATIDPARPLGPTMATLAPRHPPSTVLSTWWPAGQENRTQPTTPLPTPAVVKRPRVGFFRKELWSDTRPNRRLQHRWTLAGVARCRSRASRAARTSPVPAAESGSRPATTGVAGVWLPFSAAFWPHGLPGRRGAPPPAHAVLGGA